MALNVIHFKHHGRAQWGVVRNGLITPVPGDFATTGEFIVANTVERLASLDDPTLREVRSPTAVARSRATSSSCARAPTIAST